MIVRKLPDRWVVFLDDDGERELLRVQVPEGGISAVDAVAFGEHLLKLARERQHGPS